MKVFAKDHSGTRGLNCAKCQAKFLKDLTRDLGNYGPESLMSKRDKLVKTVKES